MNSIGGWLAFHRRRNSAPDLRAMPEIMCERSEREALLESDVADFVEVGSLAQLPEGASMRVMVGASDLLLVNVGGRVVAIGDLCLRCSRSLSTASLSGRLLTCGECGWRYDVERGCVEGLPSLRHEAHDVCVDDGRMLVARAIAVTA